MSIQYFCFIGINPFLKEETKKGMYIYLQKNCTPTFPIGTFMDKTFTDKIYCYFSWLKFLIINYFKKSW